MYGLLFGTSFLISVILLVLLYRVNNTRIAKLLIMGTILVAFWILLEALTFYVPVSKVSIFFQKIKYVSVILIPPLYVLAADEYANRKRNNIYYIVLIFIIPFSSLLSLATNSIPYKFMLDIQLSYAKNIPLFSYQPGLGFFIHTLYSYGCIFYVCYTFLMRVIKAPKLYRRQSSFIFIGSIVAFAVNILAISIRIRSLYIDFTSISMLVTLLILYGGIFHIPKAIMIPIARELLVENIKDMAIITDASDRIIDVNPAAVEFISKYANDIKNSNVKQVNFMGINIREVLEFIPDLKQANENWDMCNESTITFNLKGKTFYFRMYQAPIYDTDQSQIGRLFMLHNITQMQEYMNSLKHLNEELMISDRIISTAMEGVLITNAEGNITRVNRAFEKMAGYNKEDLIGKNPRILKSDRHDKKFYQEMWNSIIKEGHWEGEVWDRKKNGEIYPKWMSITSLKESEGELEHYIAISTDISKIKKAEEKLHKLAYYDALTGIPNRTLFYERLEMAIIRAKDNEKMVALLFMDLDGFKVINDSLGHAAGDMLLKEVAIRIKSCIRKSDTIARLGGDEFAVILENIKDAEYVKNAAEDIISEISLPFNLLQREITLRISIGIALAPDDATEVEGLVRMADAAMYDAKEGGRGRYSFSSEDIEKRNHEILDMQIKLNKALLNEEFKLYLQPQISYIKEEFKIIGAEALIRWKSIDGTIFTPDKFIPISESNGMIIPMGIWIIEEIFRIDRVLKNNGIYIKLAVNVSSKQLEMDDFVTKVKEIIEKNSEQHINLVFEVTESFLLTDLDKAIEGLLEIKKLGIGIALDDFGTGFSSLSYLTRLPINYLKIDKSFIDDIAHPEHKNITPNIISMAKTLGLETVAEGVETKEQIDRLLEEKCDTLQGYYFSKPVDLEEFIKYVKQYEENKDKN